MKWPLERDELLMLASGIVAGVAITALALIGGYGVLPYAEGAVDWRAWLGVLVFAELIAVTIALGLPSSSGIVSVVPMVIVSAFLALGLMLALIASAVGAILGGILRTALARPLGHGPRTMRRTLFTMAGDVGIQTGSLLTGAGGFRLLGGSAPLADLDMAHILPLLMLFVLYSATHLLCLAAFLWARQQPLFPRGRAEWWDVILPGLASMPISVLIAMIYNAWGIRIFTLLSIGLLGGALAIWQSGQARIRFQRRIQELSALNAVGQALTDLDLPVLLEVIHTQVARLMPSDNFYIALYDPEREFIDFAFVVEDGARVFRPGRSLGNRLADYVIRRRAPLLIRANVVEVASRLGIEPVGREPQSWLSLPMIAGNQVLGVIAIQSYERANVFEERHVEILSTIAAQAAMAVRNVHLYGQARQRSAELAMLNTVSAAVSSTLDLDRVLEMIVSSVGVLVGSQQSAIFLLDKTQGTLRLAASRGLSEEYVRACERLSAAEGGLAEVVQEKKPIVVADIHSDPRWAHFQELALQEGFRALADVPLIVEDEVIGMLATYFPEVYHFGLADVDLLTTFANQAAAAVANARLYARTQRALVRRVEELSALEVIGHQLVRTLDLERVIDLVLDYAMQATGATLGFVVMTVPEEGRGGVISCRHCVPAADELSLDTGLIGRAISTQQPVLIEDISQDPDYVPLPGVESEHKQDIRSVLIVPILHEGRVLGLINLQSIHQAAFDEQHAAFVKQLAFQAAIAIQNARLFQQAAEGRDRLQAVLNSTREGILMLDLTGHVVLANPMIEDLWGMSRAQLEGRNLADLLRGAEAGDRSGRAESRPTLAERLGYTQEELLRFLDQLPAGSSILGKDTYVLDAPQERVIERLRTPVLDESGRVWGWMLVLRDVTEEKELEGMREEVTHMIVHDLRTPLTAILGSVELIQDIIEEEPQNGLIAEALDVTAHSAQILRVRVDSLLDMNRIEAGKTKLDRHPHKLATLVNSATLVVSPLVEGAGLQMAVEVPSDLPLVEVDRDMVERILINLLDNAIKFTPFGGRVSVDAQQENGAFVRCSVHDTGPGIPREHLDHIFDRFVRLPGRSGRWRSTGLGLAFCKLAVEAHGGRIWVESEQEGEEEAEEGHGCHVHFTLPIAQQ